MLPTFISKENETLEERPVPCRAWLPIQRVRDWMSTERETLPTYSSQRTDYCNLTWDEKHDGGEMGMVATSEEHSTTRPERSPVSEQVAAVGMSCRVRGASITALYRVPRVRKVFSIIVRGASALRSFRGLTTSEHRGCDQLVCWSEENIWDLPEKGLDHGERPSDLLDNPDYRCFFDSRIFNVSPLETQQTDPKRRLTLMTAHEALENLSEGVEIDGTLNIHPYARTVILASSFLASAGAAIYEHACLSRLTTEASFDAPPDDWKGHAPWDLGWVITEQVVFITATTAIYHTNRRHRYQDRFLLAGISLGALAGMGIYRDVLDTIVEVVPWTILLALLLSLVAHGLGIGKVG